MTNRDKRQSDSAEKTVRDIRRATRRRFSAEEKIRSVLEGLRGAETIAELCRKEGIAQNLYYRWSKDFLEAGKKRLDENPQAMRQRRETVEHPFGTIKMRMGATHFLMKRLKNVLTEMA